MSEMHLRQLGKARPPPALRSAILQGALRRVHAPARSFPWRLALAGAAAAVAAIVVPLALAPRAPVGPTEHATAGAPEEIALGPHRITLAPESRAIVGGDPARADVELRTGLSAFAVAPLRAGESFRVRTAQVTVEVVGTRFDVEADGTCSRVAVREGKVRVTPAGAAAVLLVPPQERTFCGGVAAQVPSEAERLMSEALPLIAAGELDRASSLLGRALDLRPGGVVETEAVFHLWVVHSSLGHDAEAERFAGELLSREPQGGRADRVRAWLSGR